MTKSRTRAIALDRWFAARRISKSRSNLTAGAGVTFIDHPLARVRVQITGAGVRTVVFVCDPPNVIEHYCELIDVLRDQFRVVCIELPGFGFSSPKPGFRFTYSQLCAVIGDVLQRLNAGPCVLAFSCVSAYIAIHLAAVRPQLVDRLVLIQAPGWQDAENWVSRIDSGGVLRTPFLGQLMTRIRPRSIAKTWYRAALPDEVRVKSFSATADSALSCGANFCLASVFQQLFGRSPPPLPTVAVPAMVLWGGNDRTHRLSDSRSLLTYMPNGAWQQFETAGHFPELEEPHRFAEILDGFMSGTT